jgi:hypothetical protein
LIQIADSDSDADRLEEFTAAAAPSQLHTGFIMTKMKIERVEVILYLWMENW